MFICLSFGVCSAYITNFESLTFHNLELECKLKVSLHYENPKALYEQGKLIPDMLWGKNQRKYQDQDWYRGLNANTFSCEVNFDLNLKQKDKNSQIQHLQREQCKNEVESKLTSKRQNATKSFKISGWKKSKSILLVRARSVLTHFSARALIFEDVQNARKQNFNIHDACRN